MSASTAATATNSAQLGGVAASEYARTSVRTYSVTVDDDAPADFSTIQAAIASGAKSIFVRNGTYSINSIVDIPAAPFSLVGESMHGVVLNFGDNGCLRFVGDTGLPYREGTINVSSNSTTVTAATGAPAWLSNATAGDFIRIGLTYHEIASVNSEAQLALRQRYNGPSRSGVSYGIARYGTGFHFEGFTARDPRRASSTGAQDATFGAICLRFARDITIQGCRVEKNTASTFSSAGGLAYLENCHNVLVTGNSTRDSGLVATMNSALVTISDNDVSGADVAAMGAIAVSGSANDEPLFGTVITGNRVYNSRGGLERCAIFYGPLSETGIPLRGSFVIADNVVQDCFGASPVVDQSAGIMIFNPSAGTGTIANNVVRAIAGNGITFVGSNFSGIAITGNVLTGNSGFGIAGTSASGHEWRLITNNVMEGNSLGGVGVIGTAYGTLNVPSFEVPVP